VIGVLVPDRELIKRVARDRAGPSHAEVRVEEHERKPVMAGGEPVARDFEVGAVASFDVSSTDFDTGCRRRA
jgi:hypothetical protein